MMASIWRLVTYGSVVAPIGGHLQAGQKLDIALVTADAAFLYTFSLRVSAQPGPSLIHLLFRVGFVPLAICLRALNVGTSARFGAAIPLDVKGGHLIAGLRHNSRNCTEEREQKEKRAHQPGSELL